MIRNWLRGWACGAMLAAALAGQGQAAFADSLFGAMEKAYSTNPTLNAARAGQRSTDEQVPQALSGWRPTITVQGSASQTWDNTISSFNTDRDYASAGVNIQLNQPLFRGFRTVESTRFAEAQVEAGRQNLLQTEQQVLINVVQAYMNVYAGRQYVTLNQENVAALEAQVRAANERFNAGEITRTDVAQARSRLALAKSNLVNVQATLAGDVASYMQVVGNEPGKLNYPKVVGLPKSLRSALQVAAETNPQVLARAFVEIAAQHNIEVARSALLPQANLTAEASISDPDLADKTFASGDNKSASLTASVTVPVYDAGLYYSQVRQAKQLASQRRIQVIEINRAVRQAVAQSWIAYVGLGQIIQNAKTQVAAAQLALDGVKQEYQAGTRTTLDVLDAQSELIQAKVTLVTAERNRVIAGYQLISAVGKLTARDLGLNVAIYDPEAYYRQVRNKWIGTGAKTVE